MVGHRMRTRVASFSMERTKQRWHVRRLCVSGRWLEMKLSGRAATWRAQSVRMKRT